MVNIDVCVDCANILGENPLWDVAEQRLYWIDGVSSEIWSCSAEGGDVRTWVVEGVGAIGCMALRVGGGAVLGAEAGVHLFDFNTGRTDLIADPEAGNTHVRINDGKVDGRGRLIFGSMDLDAVFPPDDVDTHLPRGAIYRLDTDRSVHKIGSDIIISNGPCWSRDRSTLYLADSWRDVIYSYTWDEIEGVPGARRPFAQLPHRTIPDGGTVDAEGYVWNAVNGAYSGVGELIRFAPDGSVDRRIEMPVRKSTSLSFGGPNLDILYVTSNRLPAETGDCPLDGRLFSIRGLGIQGLPENRYAG